MKENETIFGSGLDAIKNNKVITRKQVLDLFNAGFKEGLWEACKETVIAYGVGLALLMVTFPLYRDKVQFDE
jgi:hypothetical protein